MEQATYWYVPDNEIYQATFADSTKAMLFQQQWPVNPRLIIVTVTGSSLSVKKQVPLLIILFEAYSLYFVGVQYICQLSKHNTNNFEFRRKSSVKNQCLNVLDECQLSLSASTLFNKHVTLLGLAEDAPYSAYKSNLRSSFQSKHTSATYRGSVNSSPTRTACG